MSEGGLQDVVIVGGGPAGQAAALVIAESGLRPIVIDEQQRPGGQVHRQPPKERDPKPPGDFEKADVEWWGGRSVVGLAPVDGGWTLTVMTAESARIVKARAVLIAAGCQDVPVPVPGWTRPGVMSAGGVQTLLKSQGILAGRRVVLAGTHPLQLLAAAQIVEAGGAVGAVAFAQPRSIFTRAFSAHMTTAIRHLKALWPGVAAMNTLRRAGVPVLFNMRISSIEGHDRVEAVRFKDGIHVPCDALALCFGFVPQSDLVRQANVATRIAGFAGGWAAVVDGRQQTSRSGLYAAGETTGVAGADRARMTGEIAGLGILMQLKKLNFADAEHRAIRLRASLPSHDRFAALLESVANPASYWPEPQADTFICRCEDVSQAEVSQALEVVHSASAVKLLTRCGMGLCQGRMCEPTVLRMLADRGVQADPGFTARFPARPTQIGALLISD